MSIDVYLEVCSGIVVASVDVEDFEPRDPAY